MNEWKKETQQQRRLWVSVSSSKTAKQVEEEMEKKWLMKTHVKEVCSSYKSGTSMVLHEQQ